MSGWLWLCVRMYPRRWRRRYERELVALIEDTGFGWREGLDLIAGGLTMRLTRLATLPLLAALAGAAIGTMFWQRTPVLHAASSTFTFEGTDWSQPDSPASRGLRDRLAAVTGSEDRRARTSVTIMETSPRATTFEIAVAARDEDVAKRELGELISATTEIAKEVTKSPESGLSSRLNPIRRERQPPTLVAIGALAGLSLGLLAVATRYAISRPGGNASVGD